MTCAQEPAELRPGLPPVDLRLAHALWRDEVGDVVQFSTDGDSVTWRQIGSTSIDVPDWHIADYLANENYQLAPLGKSWSEVEALAAKSAEVQS